MGPENPTFLGVFMVNNLVFRWPKLLFFMVLGAQIYIYIYIKIILIERGWFSNVVWCDFHRGLQKPQRIFREGSKKTLVDSKSHPGSLWGRICC